MGVDGVPLAISTVSPQAGQRLVTLDVSGPANSAVYIDNIFRGKIRPTGLVRIESLAPGSHSFSADFPDGTTLNGTVTLGAVSSRVSLTGTTSSPLAQLRSRVNAGQVLEPNGAWDFYSSHPFPRQSGLLPLLSSTAHWRNWARSALVTRAIHNDGTEAGDAAALRGRFRPPTEAPPERL